jgi:hypothetical protein
MITKTDFLKYLEAPRHLWAFKNGKIKEHEKDPYKEHLSKQGYKVEKLAQEFLKEVAEKDESIILLQEVSEDGQFQARIDALIHNNVSKKWDMYEIKSSTKVEKIQKQDATFQYLVFKKKYDIGKIYIVHLDKEYVREGDIDISKLFTIEDITNDVKDMEDDIHTLRYEALDVLKVKDPNELLECIKPQDCPCIDICHPNLPEYSIYDINLLTRNEKKIRELVSMGITTIYDVPSSFPLSKKQRYQVEVAQSNKRVIDLEYIKNDLHSLEYPLYFIDYETFNNAIPLFNGYKPFDQIPFQWSVHVQREKAGELEHYEFIETKKVDPIPNFLTKLKEVLGSIGSIFVWNKGFGGTINKRMGEIHPEFNDFCLDMNGRLYDLMDIFKGQYFADPKSKGSYSIKKILPILVPDLSYNGMNISDGSTAMISWYEMVYENKDMGIKNDLLKYCKLDTYAMVRIFEELEGMII